MKHDLKHFIILKIKDHRIRFILEKKSLIWKNLIYIPNNLDSSEIMIRWSLDSLSLNLLAKIKLLIILRFHNNFWS